MDAKLPEPHADAKTAWVKVICRGLRDWGLGDSGGRERRTTNPEPRTRTTNPERRTTNVKAERRCAHYNPRVEKRAAAFARLFEAVHEGVYIGTISASRTVTIAA